MARFEILPIKIGTRFFIRYDKALRECVLKGYEFNLDYNSYATTLILYMGKELGEVKLTHYKYRECIFHTLSDALKPNYQEHLMRFYTTDDDTFARMFFKGCGVTFSSKGSSIVGYRWTDGTHAARFTPRENVKQIVVRENENTLFIDDNDRKLALTNEKGWYQTAEECCASNQPKVVRLDEDDTDNGLTAIDIVISVRKCDYNDAVIAINQLMRDFKVGVK